MNLTVSGHHVVITSSMRGYVEEKLSRVTRHFDHVIDINVILSVEKLRHKAEVSLHVPCKDIHVETTDTDMYAAIDLLTDKVDRSVQKYKQTIQAHPHESLKYQPESSD